MLISLGVFEHAFPKSTNSKKKKKNKDFPTLDNDSPKKLKSYIVLICHRLKRFRRGLQMETLAWTPSVRQI